MDRIESDIVGALTDVLPQETSLDRISPDSDLIAEYGLDSLQMISFLLRIEDVFDIELDYENLRLEDLRSVRQFSEYISGLGVAG